MLKYLENVVTLQFDTETVTAAECASMFVRTEYSTFRTGKRRLLTKKRAWNAELVP